MSFGFFRSNQPGDGHQPVDMTISSRPRDGDTGFSPYRAERMVCSAIISPRERAHLEIVASEPPGDGKDLANSDLRPDLGSSVQENEKRDVKVKPQKGEKPIKGSTAWQGGNPKGQFRDYYGDDRCKDNKDTRRNWKRFVSKNFLLQFAALIFVGSGVMLFIMASSMKTTSHYALDLPGDFLSFFVTMAYYSGGISFHLGVAMFAIGAASYQGRVRVAQFLAGLVSISALPVLFWPVILSAISGRWLEAFYFAVIGGIWGKMYLESSFELP